MQFTVGLNDIWAVTLLWQPELFTLGLKDIKALLAAYVLKIKFD
jgi:hypothetical protein